MHLFKEYKHTIGTLFNKRGGKQNQWRLTWNKKQNFRNEKGKEIGLKIKSICKQVSIFKT